MSRRVAVRAVRLLLLLVMAAAASGCNAARVFVASPSDYGDYRRIRLAHRLDERLAAAAAYLERHPDGRYIKRVERYLRRAEPVYFKVRRRSAKGLSAYLRSLPRGTNQKLAVAELVRRRRQAGESLAEQLARKTQLRLDAEAAGRAVAAGLSTRWVSTLLDPRNWGVPLSRAQRQFLVPYRVALPQPRCRAAGEGWACVKALRGQFVVVGRHGNETHDLEMELHLSLDSRWRLQRAELRGRAIFSRWFEAKTNKVYPSHGDEGASIADVQEQWLGEISAERKKAGGSCIPHPRFSLGLSCGELDLLLRRGPEGQQVIVISRRK